MKRLIGVSDLSEIVTGLLNQSDQLPQVMDDKERMKFMTDIAKVVCDHCGGDYEYTFSALAPGALPKTPVVCIDNSALTLKGDLWDYLGKAAEDDVPRIKWQGIS